MLVLTRSSDQEIRIGDDIVVRVLDVKGDRVRIGIDAPAEVSVHRQEVYLEIERANRESLVVAAGGLAGARALMTGASMRTQPSGKNPKHSKNKKNGTAGYRKRPVAVSTEVDHGT